MTADYAAAHDGQKRTVSFYKYSMCQFWILTFLCLREWVSPCRILPQYPDSQNSWNLYWLETLFSKPSLPFWPTLLLQYHCICKQSKMAQWNTTVLLRLWYFARLGLIPGTACTVGCNEKFPERMNTSHIAQEQLRYLWKECPVTYLICNWLIVYLIHRNRWSGLS